MAHPDQTRDIPNRCGHRDRWKAPCSDVASASKGGPHIFSQTERRRARRNVGLPEAPCQRVVDELERLVGVEAAIEHVLAKGGYERGKDCCFVVDLRTFDE